MVLFGASTKVSRQVSEQVALQYDTSSRDVTYWNFMPSGIYSGGMSALQGGSGQEAGLSSSATVQQKDSTQVGVPWWGYALIGLGIVVIVIYGAFKLLKGNKLSLKGKFV